jgi:hypothetical protein
VVAGVLLVGLPACDEPLAEDLELRSVAGGGVGAVPGTGAPSCTPAPISNDICGLEEIPPPPAVNGECTVELLADTITFTKGQGASEGKAEASLTYLLTDLDTGGMQAELLPRSGGWLQLTKKKPHTLGQSIATYVVEEGEEKDVEVCARFREHDDDVLNGKDDLGSGCATVTLTCPQDRDSITMSADMCQGGNCNTLNGAMSTRVKVLTADADRDCVENEDDYTPEPCDEERKGQECRASLVYFYYGDGSIADLAQNLGTDLKKAMDGYDRVVLLIDQAHIGPFGIDNGEIDSADVVMDPTEGNFFASLQDLTARGCDFDTWMFSHGGIEWVDGGGVAVNNGGFVNALADNDGDQFADITTEELEDDTDPANSGTSSVPIRMTYGTPCFYEQWNAAWIGAGAKVTSGAVDIAFFPFDFERFADAWDAGSTYGAALAGESTAASRLASFALIEAEGNLFGCVNDSVIDRNACARDFFVDTDLTGQLLLDSSFVDGPDEAGYDIGGPLYNTVGITYDPAVSGAQNMIRSSAKSLVGNAAIRKDSPATLSWP